MSFHIEINNLIVNKGNFHLRIEHLSIKSSFLFVIEGASGSGKTTLLKSLIGVERTNPDFSWFLDGDPMHTKSLSERRMGVVFQGLVLFPHMTVFENILFAQKSGNVGEVEMLLNEFKLDHCRNTLAAQISGGERQRTAIAQVLASHPRIVFLDEPFSGLDEETKEQSRRFVFSALKHQGIPLVLITHDRSDYLGEAASVIRMVGGSIVEARSLN
ncbi:MAG: ATP-binding cassette domain-containing protein [Bdellovibrionaceae bacterium]|nr:ATP-binding cassette domain-containing protein [Pseudobdellovibrionaceae bacterium]MDW8189779.1 ATP-binding cassette domain-containing protein [Pseudobdellovibrionaceae bacterium]